MSDALDLSSLSDDQLVGLARLVAAEASRRNHAVHLASKHAVLDEREKAALAAIAEEKELERLRAAERNRIEEEARERARDKFRESYHDFVDSFDYFAHHTWCNINDPQSRSGHYEDVTMRKMKRDAMVMHQLFDDGWKISVSDPYYDRRGSHDKQICLSNAKKRIKVTLYVHGNQTHAPGEFVATPKPAKNVARKLEKICRHLADSWNKVEIDCDSAVNLPVQPLSIPSTLI